MAVFRRFDSPPSLGEITAIEGIVLVDMPAPQDPAGLASGVVGVVGEFADQTYACSVSTSGAVTASIRPQEITSGQDMYEKFGGFDSTLGHFGGQGGNGYAALANKRFSKLIIAPIFMASTYGCRVFRELPTNASATQATPVVPQVGAEVPAGTLFSSGGDILRIAKRVVFTGTPAIVTGTDGVAVTLGANPATAATAVFTSATGDFVNNGVSEGDVIVLGVIGGSGVNGIVADTHRIVSVDSATQLTLQKQSGAVYSEDGVSGDWDAGTDIVYRIHAAADADTGEDHQFSEAGGYLIPVRNMKGSTIAAGTVISPASPAPDADAASWAPLSGLKVVTHPSGATTYDAWMAANSNNSQFTTLYTSALAALLRDEQPINQITMVVSARNTDDINTAVLTHVENASAYGRGRICVLSPPLSDVTLASAITGTGSVTSYRDKRAIFCWPGVRAYVPQALNASVTLGDATTTTDGIIDEASNMWMASLMSNLPPEHNPAQIAEPVPTLTQAVLGFQRAASAISLTIQDYMQLKAAGVAAPSFDSEFGMAFQSGVTTSLTTGETTILRQRMSDFIGDSIASLLKPYQKMPLTETRKGAMASVVRTFLKGLQDGERITAFALDEKSGNTAEKLALGIFTLISKVQLTPSGDYIVVMSEVSELTVI